MNGVKHFINWKSKLNKVMKFKWIWGFSSILVPYDWSNVDRYGTNVWELVRMPFDYNTLNLLSLHPSDDLFKFRCNMSKRLMCMHVILSFKRWIHVIALLLIILNWVGWSGLRILRFCGYIICKPSRDYNSSFAETQRFKGLLHELSAIVYSTKARLVSSFLFVFFFLFDCWWMSISYG